MAVVKSPFMSQDARGSVGGMTASFVRGGNVMKRKAKPSTQFQPNQNRARSILGFISRQWGELITGQRDSWDAWAIDHPGTDKFGDPFIMSGFNAFIMLNHQSIRFAGAAEFHVLPPEDPPASAINTFQAVTGAINPGDIDLTWTELGSGLPGDYWDVWVAGPFQSEGRKSVAARFAFSASVGGNVLLVTIAGLDEGMFYWLRCRYVSNDGQVTAWHVAQATPMLTP